MELSVEITLDCGYNVVGVWSANRCRMHNGEGKSSFPEELLDRKRETALLLTVLTTANTSSDIDEIARSALGAIAGVIPSDLSFLLFVDPEGARVRLSHLDGAPDALLQALEHLQLPRESFRQFEDPSRAPNLLSNLVEDIRSLLAVYEYPAPLILPLLGQKPGLGALTLANRQHAAANVEIKHQAQMAFLGSVCEAVGLAWLRIRFDDQLRASEAKYRSFVEESPDGFWESDAYGFITYVNKAALDLVGYPREEILGAYYPSFAIDDQAAARERAFMLRRDGYVVDRRINFHAKDGSRKTANMSIRSVLDATGKIVKYQAIVRDVTANTRLEEELRGRVAELEAIARIGEMIAQSPDPEEPLREIARDICQVLVTDSVSFQLREGDMMRRLVSSVPQSTLVPMLDYHRQIMEGSEPRVVADVDATDADEGQRERMRELGFASSVGVRLFAQGAAIGILFVNHRTPRYWKSEEVRLIGTFARQVAGAIHNTSLLRESQARVRELEGVADMSMFAASLIGEDPLIDLAQQFITDALGVDIVAVHLLDGERFRPGRVRGVDRAKAETIEMTPELQRVLEERNLFIYDVEHPLPQGDQGQSRLNSVSAHAVLMMPIVTANSVIGLLGVGRRDEHVWTRAEKRSVQTIANQLAIGIANARLLGSLKQERAELEATLNSVFSGVFTTDESGNIQTWNRAAAQMTGFSAERMRGENWAAVAHIGDGPDNLIFEAMVGGDVVFGLAPRTLITASGSVIPLGEAAAPLRDQTGKIRGAVGAFWDRSKEHAAERAKLDFLHEVSHELRNSLTAVLSMSPMIRDKRVQGATRERAIRVLSEQVDRLRAFSDRLLEFEREQFEQPLEKEPLDIRKELGRLVAAARLEHPDHRFSISGRAGAVRVDRGRLGTVVTNLLANAAKFSPAHSRISVKCEQLTGERVGVSIRNEGPGIPAEERERIFRRGYHAPVEGMDFQSASTGIGLWLVETKLREMGGEICVASDGIKGVTFAFTLRQARGEDVQVEIQNSGRGRRQSGAGLTRSRSRARRV